MLSGDEREEGGGGGRGEDEGGGGGRGEEGGGGGTGGGSAHPVIPIRETATHGCHFRGDIGSYAMIVTGGITGALVG